MRIAAIVLSFGLCFQVHASCLEEAVQRRLSAEEFQVLVQAPGGRFHVWANVDGQGTLHLNFKTVTKTGERSEALSGSREFSKVLAHFGSRVKRIEGYWVHDSDNLLQFRDALRAGNSPNRLRPRLGPANRPRNTDSPT